ncbi:ERVV2 protein, partial [Sapayoa aenigma]|nr:ERVV2 protein [Sapayoa aenigma]
TAQMGGVCTLINTTCCTYIDHSGQIKKDIQNMWAQSKVFHRVAQGKIAWGLEELWEKLISWLPSLGWIKQLFVILLMLVALGVLFLVLVRCLLWCIRETKHSYVNWKKHQLRQQVELGNTLEKL